MKTILFAQELDIRWTVPEPGSTAMGRSDNKNNVIWLNKELPPEVMQTTLLHEYMHLLSDILHLELTEEQVCGICTGLYSTGITLPVKEE